MVVRPVPFSLPPLHQRRTNLYFGIYAKYEAWLNEIKHSRTSVFFYRAVCHIFHKTLEDDSISQESHSHSSMWHSPHVCLHSDIKPNGNSALLTRSIAETFLHDFRVHHVGILYLQQGMYLTIPNPTQIGALEQTDTLGDRSFSLLGLFRR
jgi:hypothetical protein